MRAVRATQAHTRANFRAASGVLLVLRTPAPPVPPVRGQPPAVLANPAEGDEIVLAVWDDGSVTGLHGHVDLGTGLRTALAQIVAEELALDIAQVEMRMGDTASVPNQGATIASASIQIHAAPLRAAAALARAWLVDAAGDGAIDAATLLRGRHIELHLPADVREVPVKDPSDYTTVGRSVPRVDIPAKASGAEVFVHDKRLPGMLHGRVVRPPYAGVDAGDFVGNTLESVDEASIAHIPGVRSIVVIRDFVGIVAEREEQAEAAMRALKVVWKPWPGMPPLGDLKDALRANPSTRRVLVDEGDVRGAIAGSAQSLQRDYVWPYQLHGSIGPSCALADWHGDAADGTKDDATDGAVGITVWAGTQNPHVLRADLAKLLALPDTAVDVIRMEAAGCYGRNAADDVAADAALLSRALGAPVRVQLTREQEHLWEPKGAAQLMQIDGALGADGSMAAYDFQTSYPSNGATTLALLLTRTVEPKTLAYEMGDRTAVPPYAVPNLRVVANDMAPILRASWLRGVSALPNSFAHESFIDELATAAGVDPVDYRLRHLKDHRAAELVRLTAARAGWIEHTKPQQQASQGDVLKGQGFAYSRYSHSKFPGFSAAWAAWVADVEVNRVTGDVHVSRVVVGHDAGTMINPAGVRHQVHGNVLQTTSRALKERVEIEPATNLPVSREWGSYPILSFREVPVVEVMLMPRPGEPPLGAGESSSVPGTAAIANAIFDATGVRFREPPFTPEVVRAGLGVLSGKAEARGPSPQPDPSLRSPQRGEGAVSSLSLWERAGVRAARTAALAIGTIAAFAGLLGWRPSIAPVAASSATVYTAETIDRGRQLAAAGDCIVCHTAPGGIPNAGGRALETPFGAVYSTNLTPDPVNGIGTWSFSAFQRAMREGISRDGQHLYPAFPYTAFTRTSDDDLTALYAYLMSQPAVASAPAKTQLAFPFNLRPLMALWNALYLTPGPQPVDPARSAQWNRGAYLVNGLGHCGACHTPRSALGAELGGASTFAGATVDGWQAPALTALSTASASPIPWTESELFRYLRLGHSAHHGSASGPMAPVVRELAELPEADVRAMAHYLASFNPPPDEARNAAQAKALIDAAQQRGSVELDAAQRLFSGACGACHHAGNGPEVFGQNLPLALSSKLHSAQPDNLLRVILEGVREPASRELGFMPAFRDALDDAQVARLAAYMRARFASGQPPWRDLEAASARLRAHPSSR